MAKNSEETYLAFVEGSSDDGTIGVRIVSFENEKLLLKLKFAKVKDFIDGMKSLFKPKFKAIVLDIFDLKDSEYSNNVEICLVIKEKLDELKIAYNFVCKESYILSCLLIAGNIIPAKYGEIILIFWVQNNQANCFDLKFTENGFEIIGRRFVNLETVKIDQKEIRKIILGTFNHQKIYFFSTASMQINGVRKICKSKNLIFCEAENYQSVEKFLVETYKWMLEKSCNKFRVLPISARRWEIGFKSCNDKMFSVIVCKNGSLLPFKKSVEIPITSLEFFMAYIESGKSHQITTFKLDKNAHRYEVTLSIDENNIPKFLLSPIQAQNILNLPQKFDETITTKIPVISFFDNSSVICVYNEKGYQFLENWNGKYGQELFIAFDKEELAYFAEAIPIYQTKPSFVIYDLLKIMSMPMEQVLAINTLSFSLAKDLKNDGILLEFDNFDGNRKSATPAFLMSLFLKEHLKAIKDEIDEIPKELCFCFPMERDIENRKRIVKHLEESCKFIEIGCSFIDV